MPGERTEMRRPAVKMAAAMPAAEMSTTAMMTAAAAVMTAAAAATVTTSMTTAASRSGEVRHGQRHCKNNRGNSQCDL